MQNSARMRAEKLFSPSRETDEQELNSKARARKEREDKVSRLRDLRRAKEAADLAKSSPATKSAKGSAKAR